MQLHHKGRLVIGVENTPTWVFDVLRFLVIDLGGTLGQIGKGEHATAFDHDGVTMGPAICYEGLYGDFFGEFVRCGAQFMAIVSNDGWWGDTPGYRHLFTISRLRAIEHRRAIARAANTGRSGFISPRGDVGETLGWEQRGVITSRVPLESRTTIYTRYGDYIARIAVFLLALCVLYAVVYRVKRKIISYPKLNVRRYMNYSQTLEFLFTSLPAFETKGATAYKPGLERIAAFCKAMGNPQRNFSPCTWREPTVRVPCLICWRRSCSRQAIARVSTRRPTCRIFANASALTAR